MKKSAVFLTVLVAFAILTSSCATPTTVTIPTTMPTTTSDTQGFAPISAAFTAVDLGLKSISPIICFWSPQANYLIFSAYEAGDTDNTENVYLFQQPNQLTKIIDGHDYPVDLIETPEWSADESFFTISFYPESSAASPINLYYVKEERLETLPIEGCNPAISPDMSKLAYINGEQVLSIYTMATEANVIARPDAVGSQPLWFADQRILFIRSTGENPSGLDGAILAELTVLDTTSPEYTTSFGDKKVYRNIEWIVQDELVEVTTGWDDGGSTNLLILKRSKNYEFPEGPSNIFDQEGQVYVVYYMHESDTLTLFDLEHSAYNIVQLTTDPQSTITVVALLGYGRLLYLEGNNQQNKSLLQLNDFAGKDTLVTSLDGIYNYASAANGTKFSLINKDGSELIIFYSTRIG